MVGSERAAWRVTSCQPGASPGLGIRRSTLPERSERVRWCTVRRRIRFPSTVRPGTETVTFTSASMASAVTKLRHPRRATCAGSRSSPRGRSPSGSGAIRTRASTRRKSCPPYPTCGITSCRQPRPSRTAPSPLFQASSAMAATCGRDMASRYTRPARPPAPPGSVFRPGGSDFLACSGTYWGLHRPGSSSFPAEAGNPTPPPPHPPTSGIQAGQLLVDHGRVELGEDRGRLGDRGADARPAGDSQRGRVGVVAGDDRVDVSPAPSPGSRSSTCSMRGIGMNSPSPPSTTPTVVGRVRQERREQRVAVAHALGGDVQHRAEPLALRRRPSSCRAR